MTDPASSELAAACALLREAVAAIAAGGDLPPARHFAIEMLLGRALTVGNMTATALHEVIDPLLPAGAALHVDAPGGRVMLELWQARAPVVPSTPG